MTDTQAARPRAAMEGTSTKLAYGFGSVAYGVKDNGFAYFLLLFYSQVLGVPPGMASLAIFLALLVDAVTDPIIGSWSDALHSRWGRRHPFMYASAIPVAIAFYFLWNPPGDLRGADLFPYLLALAILIRVSITLYEIPSTALVAELTDNYDQRTSFLSFRYFFGWWGGLTIAVVALTMLLVPTAEEENGYFNEAGYGTYGLIGAILIFLSILVSALGTHRHIPDLRDPPPKRPFNLQRFLGELAETLSNRSFFAIFFASLVFGMAAGISTNLNHYFNNFFWELTTQQAGYITASAFISAAIALFMAPLASRTLGKKRGAITIGFVAFVTAPAPIILRLVGFFPEPGTQALFFTLFFVVMIDVALIITAQVLITSMIADIVEESELKTGRRSEGVFFAAQTFARKAVNGFGVLIAGAILAFVQFPAGARPEDVDPETIRNFALVYVPCILFFYLGGVAILSFYKIDRRQHEDNLARAGLSPACRGGASSVLGQGSALGSLIIGRPR